MVRQGGRLSNQASSLLWFLASVSLKTRKKVFTKLYRLYVCPWDVMLAV